MVLVAFGVSKGERVPSETEKKYERKVKKMSCRADAQTQQSRTSETKNRGGRWCGDSHFTSLEHPSFPKQHAAAGGGNASSWSAVVQRGGRRLHFVVLLHRAQQQICIVVAPAEDQRKARPPRVFSLTVCTTREDKNSVHSPRPRLSDFARNVVLV